MPAPSQPIHIDALTRGRPFCAGLLLIYRRRLVFTLSKPKRWERTGGAIRIPLACVGGGQEPGESIVECAAREAREEIGCEVRLKAAAQTCWVDLSGESALCRTIDAIAPVMFQLQPGPATPFKAGLPAGPVLYVAHYLAEPLAEPFPSDVPALIEFSAAEIPSVLAGVRLDEVIRAGAALKERTELPRAACLFAPIDSSEARLLQMVRDGAIRPDEIDLER